VKVKAKHDECEIQGIVVKKQHENPTKEFN
jgi:hypothetical protein